MWDILLFIAALIAAPFAIILVFLLLYAMITVVWGVAVTVINIINGW